MALNGIKRFLGLGSDEEPAVVGTEDEFYQVSKEEMDEEGNQKNKMILFEPRAYSESSQIVDYLKNRKKPELRLNLLLLKIALI